MPEPKGGFVTQTSPRPVKNRHPNVTSPEIRQGSRVFGVAALRVLVLTQEAGHQEERVISSRHCLAVIVRCEADVRGNRDRNQDFILAARLDAQDTLRRPWEARHGTQSPLSASDGDPPRSG